MKTSHLPSLPKSKAKSQDTLFPTAVGGQDLITETSRLAYDDFFKFGIYPPSSESGRIRKLLEENEMNYAMNGDYIKSKRCQVLQRDLDQHMSQIETEAKKEQEINEIEEQIKRQQENIHEIEVKWNEKMKEFIFKHEEKVEKVQNQQKMDMYYYCEKFEKPQNLSKFAKPSIELLDMRAKERVLVVSNRFSEARAQELEADRFEEKEVEQKQKFAEKEVQSMVNSFAQKQCDDIAKMDKRARVQLDELKKKKETELQTAKLRLNKLQIDLETAKNSTVPKKESSVTLQTQLFVEKQTARSGKQVEKQSRPNRPSTTMLFRQEQLSTKLKVFDDNNKLIKNRKKVHSQQNYRPQTKTPLQLRLSMREKLKTLPQFDI